MVREMTMKSISIPEWITDLMISDFLQSEDGATAIEYALLAALIGTTVIGAQTALGQTVVNMYQTAVGIITSAMST